MVTISRLVSRSAITLLLGVAYCGVSVAAVRAAPNDGYVRLAHLSPDTPAVDVYLYPAGAKNPRLVLRHVAYGAMSPYQRLATGGYSVAMRPADAAAASPPVLSTKLTVRPGQSYTVAGMGPYKGIVLKVLHDTANVPAGRACLRIIQASAREPTVKVTAAGQPLAGDLSFPATTPYTPVQDGSVAIKVTGASGGSPATTDVPLKAGTTHTIVILDGGHGLKILDMPDTTEGAETPPRGGIDTGLGGLARASRPDPATPWLLAGLAAVLGAVVAARRLVRRPAR